MTRTYKNLLYYKHKLISEGVTDGMIVAESSKQNSNVLYRALLRRFSIKQ